MHVCVLVTFINVVFPNKQLYFFLIKTTGMTISAAFIKSAK